MSDVYYNKDVYIPAVSYSYSSNGGLNRVDDYAVDRRHLYTYDADGLRLSKTVGDVEHKYVWQGGKLVSEYFGGKELEFFYDESGSPYAFSYKTSANAIPSYYYYVTNLQGDVVSILDANGNEKASYSYNAWGKILSATGDMAFVNPLRYRGYYYDDDTGFYYIKSRYYDPQIQRFINADELASTGQSIIGTNMFAYCGNNPVSRVDSNGHFWNTVIGAVAGAIVGGISAALSGADITAGIVSGALSGAISGAAVDIAIATGGAGLVALVGVTIASGVGGAASSYVNQRMNGKSHHEVDRGTVAIDGVWGAVGGALSFGIADVGGKMCKSLAENLALKGRAFWRQVNSDFASALTIAAGTWLNGTKMNLLKVGKPTLISVY